MCVNPIDIAQTEGMTLLRFVELIQAAEREACAQVVEAYPYWLGRHARQDIAKAIRVRSGEE